MNRKELYDRLPEELKILYSSEEEGELRAKIFTTYKIEKVDAFIDLVGDTILGLHKISDLQKKLIEKVEIDATTAASITSELQEFLQPVAEAEKADPTRGTPAYNPAPVESEDDAAAQPADNLASPAVAQTEVAEAVPPNSPEPPVELSDVSPLRTMTSDIEKIHGYGARPAAAGEPAEDEESVYRSSQDDSLGQA